MFFNYFSDKVIFPFNCPNREDNKLKTGNGKVD